MSTTVKFFISLLFVLLLSNQVFATEQQDITPAQAVPVIHFPTDHGPNRAPSMITVPDVYFIPSLQYLAFIASSDVTFTFTLQDERGRIIHSSILSLDEGRTFTYDVSNLPDGNYTVLLQIQDCVIFGDFMMLH